MSDLIDRQDVLDAVNDCGICIQSILDIPSAEPERKKGKWIVHLYELGRERYECSECAGRCDLGYDYCPNCGAEMTR